MRCVTVCSVRVRAARRHDFDASELSVDALERALTVEAGPGAFRSGRAGLEVRSVIPVRIVFRESKTRV